jgi:hypothetical protein
MQSTVGSLYRHYCCFTSSQIGRQLMTHLHCASMIFWSRLWKYDDGFQRRTVKSTVKACLKPQEGTRKQKCDCSFQRRTVKSTVKVEEPWRALSRHVSSLKRGPENKSMTVVSREEQWRALSRYIGSCKRGTENKWFMQYKSQNSVQWDWVLIKLCELYSIGHHMQTYVMDVHPKYELKASYFSILEVKILNKTADNTVHMI